ncbi:hypothetical protein NL676_004340 [Syzygium grande]|nr:hypothetical protein NL676_004340 [Syzygium grande]
MIIGPILGPIHREIYLFSPATFHHCSKTSQVEVKKEEEQEIQILHEFPASIANAAEPLSPAFSARDLGPPPLAGIHLRAVSPAKRPRLPPSLPPFSSPFSGSRALNRLGLQLGRGFRVSDSGFFG